MAERERLCRERAAEAADYDTRRNWEDSADEWRDLILQVTRQQEGGQDIAPWSPAGVTTRVH